MNCQKCGTEGAHFTGSSESWGPDESDAANTAENLPGGFAWLCEDCLSLLIYYEMDHSGEDPFSHNALMKTYNPAYDAGEIGDWK